MPPKHHKPDAHHGYLYSHKPDARDRELEAWLDHALHAKQADPSPVLRDV